MTTQEQAYIEGFVKRASEYGYSEDEAVNILKEAGALTTIAKMEAKGVDPRLLKRILASRKQLADEIRYSRNSAAPYNKSMEMQKKRIRPSEDFLKYEHHPAITKVNDDLRDTLDLVHFSGGRPRNVKGIHEGILGPELEREALQRLRADSLNLPNRVYSNVESKLL